MEERPVEILLVEDDADLAEMIEQHLSGAMWANVTQVRTAGEGLREELTTQHEVVIASLSLPDTDGLAFVGELRNSNKCPVILTAQDPSVDEAVEAIRLGVSELLIKPFDLAYLSEVVDTLAQREVKRRRQRLRYRRLRHIASRIIRERKDLNRRMDLICRDFVHAYRRLAKKVTESGMLKHEYHE
ncbi:MAG: response regulator [Planctomycetota bacterium]|nr:MAG: response regulator [Planctomycetota bacterium]